MIDLMMLLKARQVWDSGAHIRVFGIIIVIASTCNQSTFWIDVTGSAFHHLIFKHLYSALTPAAVCLN
jgi:hypothetical protein